MVAAVGLELMEVSLYIEIRIELEERRVWLINYVSNEEKVERVRNT